MFPMIKDSPEPSPNLSGSYHIQLLRLGKASLDTSRRQFGLRVPWWLDSWPRWSANDAGFMTYVKQIRSLSCPILPSEKFYHLGCRSPVSTTQDCSTISVNDANILGSSPKLFQARAGGLSNWTGHWRQLGRPGSSFYCFPADIVHGILGARSIVDGTLPCLLCPNPKYVRGREP